MTALCGGGTSAPKTGASAVVDYTSGLIAAIFAAYDITWLIPVIPLVGLAPLTLSTFCATDPPAVPTFTAAEIAAMLGANFGSDFSSGVSKLKDLILNAIWQDTCTCTSGTLVPLTPPAPPAGTPITQFQTQTYGGSNVCHDQSQLVTPLQIGTFDYQDWTFLTGRPSGLSGFRVIIHQPAPSGGQTVPASWVIQERNTSSGTLIKQTPIPLGFDTQITIPIAVQGTALGVSVNNVQVIGTSTYNSTTGIQIELQGLCGPLITGPGVQPCCPPDPLLSAQIDQILKAVTLIQRQAVPFAYIAGTVHSGVSGNGVLSVSGLIGVKIDITTDPSSLGVEGIQPPILFDRGFFTWGTPDGYPQSERLERTHQLSLPARASAFTDFAYDLHPGVVVTITELVREP